MFLKLKRFVVFLKFLTFCYYQGPLEVYVLELQSAA